MSNRPNIPIEIKRRVLRESGYRCAIPTCRFPLTENAHIISWAESQDHKYENIISLCPNCHTLYDSGRISREAIIYYKKKLMFLNEVYSRFEVDVLDYLKNHDSVTITGELLIKHLLEEGIVRRTTEEQLHGFNDLDIFSVILTDKGKKLLEDWSKVDKSLTHDDLFSQ